MLEREVRNHMGPNLDDSRDLRIDGGNHDGARKSSTAC